MIQAYKAPGYFPYLLSDRKRSWSWTAEKSKQLYKALRSSVRHFCHPRSIITTSLTSAQIMRS